MSQNSSTNENFASMGEPHSSVEWQLSEAGQVRICCTRSICEAAILRTSYAKQARYEPSVAAIGREAQRHCRVQTAGIIDRHCDVGSVEQALSTTAPVAITAHRCWSNARSQNNSRRWCVAVESSFARVVPAHGSRSPPSIMIRPGQSRYCRCIGVRICRHYQDGRPNASTRCQKRELTGSCWVGKLR